jgi:hypothetical protein
MNAVAAPTVREALAEYRRSNNLPADESATRSWTCGLGPITVRLPNFRWRRRAILAHDVHHILTGYPCTMRGECQMAAWEFGAGPMPHLAARLFCLPLVPLGLLWSPCAMVSAFLAGRRSQSLHGAMVGEGLLDISLDAARKRVGRVPVSQWSPRDCARFALLILEAGLIVLTPVMLVAASVLTLRALS